MTIYTTVREVMDEQGIICPSRLFGGEDPVARRLVAIANRAAFDLVRAHDWGVLQREWTFDTEDGVDNYQVPEDWDHAAANVAWNRTTYWSMRGNLTPQQWQVRRSALVSSAARHYSYRLLVGPLAGSILLDPVPGGVDSLVIEYVSRYWSQTADGVPQAAIAADTDEIRIDHELYTLALTWRVRRSYGLPYADERADYEVALKSAIGNDINMPIVSMAPGRSRPYPNISDGSWGQ